MQLWELSLGSKINLSPNTTLSRVTHTPNPLTSPTFLRDRENSPCSIIKGRPPAVARAISCSPKLTKGAEVKLWGVEGVAQELVEVHMG